MEDKQFLLTYQCKNKGYGTFAWFKTEEELQKFVDENSVHVIEAIKVIQWEDAEY